MPPAELAEVVATVSPNARCTTALSGTEAIALAQQGRDRILVTGSLHLAGEMLAILGGKPAAFEECAQ
jgi:folylpolyglutamate synthase/dihydropteroate synthase